MRMVKFTQAIKQSSARLVSLVAAIGLVALMPSAALAAGYTWTDRSAAGARLWTGIAASSDGKKLAATYQGSADVWLSTDAGETWASHDSGTAGLGYITSSADGTRLAAVEVTSPGFVWTSSDSGITWTVRNGAGARNWVGVTMSSDGKHIVATSITSDVYYSGDFGVTWSTKNVAGSGQFRMVAMSADGSRLVTSDTAIGGGNVWISSDYGDSWTDTGLSAPNWAVFAITSSADGSHLVVSTYTPGDIYTSSDYGANWTNRPYGGDQIFMLASSSTGKYLAASGSGGGTYIYTSADYGLTWTQQVGAGDGSWRGIRMSADGSRIATINYNNGDIWTAFDASLVPGLPNTGYGSDPSSRLLLIVTLLTAAGAISMALARYSKR